MDFETFINALSQVSQRFYPTKEPKDALESMIE